MTSGLLGACEDGGACDESWSWTVRLCSGAPTRSALLCCRRAQIRKCFVRKSECDDVMLFVFALLSACVCLFFYVCDLTGQCVCHSAIPREGEDC